jgi:Uma2 family endonuclease
MAAATLVSVAEYLTGDYEPDCDYVDGVLEERNVGEHDHSRLQIVVGAYFVSREKQWGIRAFSEQRIQVSPTRFRIPDICVMLGKGPFTKILQAPPFICIEILSPEDRIARLQKRIDDYLKFGVPNVWMIDPGSRRAYTYSSEGSREAKDNVLRTGNPGIFLNLNEIFEIAGPHAEPDSEEAH